VIVTWHFKIHKEWRQLLKTPPVKICEFYADSQQPFYKGFFEELHREFPSIPQKCPMEPGRYYTYNVTSGDIETDVDMNDKFLATKAGLPNGLYRMNFKLSTVDDPDAAVYHWIFEVNRRLNDGKF
jgi:Protein of unknown function (DUF1091)